MKKRTVTEMRAAPVMLLCFLALCFFLSACSSGASKNSSAYDAGGTGYEMIAETTAASYDYETAAAAAEEMGSAISASSEITAAPGTERKLIRNVNLSVETDAFDELLQSLQNQIAALSGYVERSDISGSSMESRNRSSSRYASVTARIPSDKLDQFIGVVQEQSNVTYKSETTSDVTLQYSDLESRKKSLTVEQDRLWALLEKADTLEAVIALEERLSEIRYELESMESQLRLYDNQVDYSTVYIDIREVRVFTPTEPESVGTRIRNGFSDNLEALGTFATDTFIAIVSGSPIWVPVLLILAAVLILIRRIFIRQDSGKETAAPGKRLFGKRNRNEGANEGTDMKK